jgi:hypothetical protein
VALKDALDATLTYVWFFTKLCTVLIVLLPPLVEPDLFAPYIPYAIGLEIVIALILWRTIWLARRQRWSEADIFLWLAAAVFFGGLAWWNDPHTVANRAVQRVTNTERLIADAARVEYPDRERDERRRNWLNALRLDLKTAEYRERSAVGSPELTFCVTLTGLSLVNLALAVWWFRSQGEQ